MTSEMTARPARRHLAEMTLDEALNAGSGTMLHRQDAGRSMAGAARRASTFQNSTFSDDTGSAESRGAVAICSVGAAAMAATVTVTMALSTGPSANAASSAILALDDHDLRAPLVKLNPAVPFSEHDAGGRIAPSPVSRDHGTLTAALNASNASTTAAVTVANPIARTWTDETSLGAGFANPRTVGKSLGRLAQELPKAQAKTAFVQYASLGVAARSAAKSYSSSRLSGNISTGGKATSCLPSDLKRVLNEAAAKFGHIRISSTHRSHSHNRRVGGAPRSLHLECRAVDFAYSGGRRGALIKFLRNHGDVGGLGVYGGSGHIHIDDGPHRTW